MNCFGNENQLVEVKQYTLTQGREAGVSCIDICGSSGLSCTVVIDRGLDIAQVRYLGKNISYQSPNGIPHPTYYAHTERSKNDAFIYGMLTTCGLENIGPESQIENETYPRHGTLCNIPATDVWVEKHIAPDASTVTIHGTVTQYLYGQYHYQLRRAIRFDDQAATIEVTDVVENRSAIEQPVFLMYHYNFGYPFLSPSAKLSIPSHSVQGKNPHAQAHLAEHLRIEAPDPAWQPQVFYHSFPQEGINWVSLENPELRIGATLSFGGDTLPFLNHWKMFRPIEYVLSLEPCTQPPLGRKHMEPSPHCQRLAPDKQRTFVTKLQLRSL